MVLYHIPVEFSIVPAEKVYAVQTGSLTHLE